MIMSYAANLEMSYLMDAKLSDLMRRTVSSMEKDIEKIGSNYKQPSFGGSSIKKDISILPEIGHSYFALTAAVKKPLAGKKE
jgi:hypothetical protein